MIKVRDNVLNDRLFEQLCKDNDEAFKRLFLHTEVRCVSKDDCRYRLWNTLDSVLLFFFKNKRYRFKWQIATFEDRCCLHNQFIRKM